MHKAYLDLIQYIRMKRVLKFVKGAWIEGSLAEYTDNATLSELISEVTYFQKESRSFLNL